MVPANWDIMYRLGIFHSKEGILNLERTVVDEAMENTDSSVHEQDARTRLEPFFFAEMTF